MRCPDCGGELVPAELVGGDKSYRCFRCGGFFADGWVVNAVTNKQLAKWSALRMDEWWLNQGMNACPVDGAQLVRYRGESVPETMVVKKCDRCGRWWFPTDSLLSYKPAQEAKLNYFKLWGMTADVASLVLPALGIVLVLLGTVVGTKLIQQRQGSAVEAQSAITDFSTTYLETGEVLISFRSTVAIDNMEMRKAGENEWQKIGVARSQGNIYITRLRLDPGEYEARIWKREYKFRI